VDTETLMLGLAIGFIAASFLFIGAHVSYRRTLLSKASGPDRTAEKMPDGNFYYIVPEHEYNEMKTAQLGTVIRDHFAYIKQSDITPPVPHA
jgi:hypothetical protein